MIGYFILNLAGNGEGEHQIRRTWIQIENLDTDEAGKYGRVIYAWES